mgnify:CR=1 FL=1
MHSETSIPTYLEINLEKEMDFLKMMEITKVTEMLINLEITMLLTMAKARMTETD